MRSQVEGKQDKMYIQNCKCIDMYMKTVRKMSAHKFMYSSPPYHGDMFQDPPSECLKPWVIWNPMSVYCAFSYTYLRTCDKFNAQPGLRD